MNLKMNTIANCVFFIVITYIALCICKAPFAGPYDIVFKSAFKCSNDTDVSKYRMRIGKLNRTHLIYNDTVCGTTGIRDSMKAVADVSVFGNGGWKDNFTHAELHHFCTDLQKFCPGMTESILKAAGREFTGCPIPGGSYYIKDWIFHINLVMPVLPYSTYRLTIKVFENDTLITCFGGEGDVVPKEKKTGRKNH